MAKSKLESLSSFERWMAESNLHHVLREGLDVVVERLKANGYSRVAEAVREAAKGNMMHMRLTVDLMIDPQGESAFGLSGKLKRIVRDMIYNGDLTHKTQATVEQYEINIELIDDNEKHPV